MEWMSSFCSLEVLFCSFSNLLGSYIVSGVGALFIFSSLLFFFITDNVLRKVKIELLQYNTDT